jgi:hypothetical protein
MTTLAPDSYDYTNQVICYFNNNGTVQYAKVISYDKENRLATIKVTLYLKIKTLIVNAGRKIKRSFQRRI